MWQAKTPSRTAGNEFAGVAVRCDIQAASRVHVQHPANTVTVTVTVTRGSLPGDGHGMMVGCESLRLRRLRTERNGHGHGHGSVKSHWQLQVEWMMIAAGCAAARASGARITGSPVNLMFFPATVLMVMPAQGTASVPSLTGQAQRVVRHPAAAGTAGPGPSPRRSLRTNPVRTRLARRGR